MCLAISIARFHGQCANVVKSAVKEGVESGGEGKEQFLLSQLYMPGYWNLLNSRRGENYMTKSPFSYELMKN